MPAAAALKDLRNPEFAAVAFPKLSDAPLADLEAVGERQRHPAGEILFRTGHTDLGLHVVLSGGVEVFDCHDHGEHPITEVGPREFIGDVSMLTGGAAFLNARVKADAEILTVPAGPGLRKVFAEMPSVSATFVRAFIARREKLVTLPQFSGPRCSASRNVPLLSNFATFSTRTASRITSLTPGATRPARCARNTVSWTTRTCPP